MADNVQLPATGTGTADVVVATDDVSGVHFQEVKLFESTLGSTTPTGVTANPLQVALPAATVTTLTPPAAITGFATSAKQLPDGHTVALSATDNAVLDTIDAAIDAINAKLVTGTDIGDVTVNNSTGAAAVNIQDGGNTITVDGTVAVTNAGITSIDGKITACNTGAVVIASGSCTVDLGANNDVTVTNGTAANLKCEATIAASQTIAVTNTGTFAVQAALDGAGLDIIYSIDLDETEEDIKGTAGKIYGYYLFNNTAAVAYVRFYNATAANTTVGTTATMLIVPLPAGAAANCSFPQGITFSTALCFAATTGVAANDTTGPAANGVVATVFYK